MNKIKIPKNDVGIWRRICGKTWDAITNQIDTLINKDIPSCREQGKNYDYVLIVVSETVYQGIKRMPGIIRKGRWFYISHRGKIMLVKYVKLEPLKECFEIKVVRIDKCEPRPLDPERVKELTKEHNLEKGIKLEWEPIEIPWKEIKK